MGATGCVGSPFGSDEVELEEPVAVLEEEREFGHVDPNEYRTLFVKVIECESVQEIAAMQGTGTVATHVQQAVQAGILEGGIVRRYRSEADFLGLDGWEEYDDRANAYILGSREDEGADLYQGGGANIWVTSQYTRAHPVHYKPTVYTPSYDISEEDRFPHGWGETPYATAHELGHLMVNTTGDIEENIEPLTEDPFDEACDEGDLCHRDHTLAGTVELGDEIGVTVMSRASNYREHQLGECGEAIIGDEQLYHGSDCFHQAADQTLSWAEKQGR